MDLSNDAFRKKRASCVCNQCDESTPLFAKEAPKLCSEKATIWSLCLQLSGAIFPSWQHCFKKVKLPYQVEGEQNWPVYDNVGHQKPFIAVHVKMLHHASATEVAYSTYCPWWAARGRVKWRELAGMGKKERKKRENELWAVFLTLLPSFS